MKLTVKNLSKKYGRNTVIKNASFEANSGECIGILGGNGSGKTTLLSAIAGMCNNVKKEVYFEDQNYSPANAQQGYNNTQPSASQRLEFAYVPQQNPLMEELSAYDNLRLWYKKEIIKLSLENGLLRRLGINSFIDKKVSEMSGGMKKRLAIGCAMSNNAPVVLMDEPTAALDLQAKFELYQIFDELKSTGHILILVTHEKEEIEKCDRLYIFNDGILLPYEYDGDERKLAEDINLHSK